MDYLLVKNQTIVLVGPMNWRPRYFQLEINDLVENGDLPSQYTVSPAEQGYINVGNGIEFYPVNLDTPAYDPNFQYLAGPFWTFDNTTNFVATGTYNVLTLDIPSIRDNLKQKAAIIRYEREQLGTTANVTSDNVSISVFTDRTNRTQYITLLNSIGSNTINFKSNAGFLQLSNTDIQNIVNAVNNYVQSQFDWELSIENQINAANTVEELQAIIITTGN
jgi:hypothetical protein